VARDYETRLERLETAKGINVPQILVLMPGEDKTAKLAEFRRERGLCEDHPISMLEVVYVDSPHRPS
jgi:hypothetical protein